MKSFSARSLAETLISAEKGGNDWQILLHGRREVLNVVENVQVVAHEASEGTCKEYAKILQDMVVERIEWELRHSEAKAA